MKIAHIVSTFPPYKGGMGMVAWQEARLLAGRGHGVTVFTPRYPGQVAREIIEGVRVERLRPLVCYGNAAILWQLPRVLAGFDVAHLHYPFFGSAGLVARAGQRLIIQYHMDVLRDDWLAGFFLWYARSVTPRLLARADRLIVSSFDYARSSAIAGMVGEKMVEIPLGVDTELFKPSGDSLQHDPQILFVGGLDRPHYFKGLPVLLEAMRGLADEKIAAQLMVIGDGDLRVEYEALARTLGISDRVKFLGAVEAKDLRAWYAHADIFVLPSTDRSEAFGLVLLEAMSSGVPVIASDLPGVRTVVDPNVTGYLVPPRDVNALKNRLKELLADPTKREQMGAAGRKRVIEKYRWKDIVGELEKIYLAVSSRAER